MSRFRLSKLNEISIPRTLCKLTFSDMLIVQEALSKISDSSLAYEKYVAAREPVPDLGRHSSEGEERSPRSARIQSTNGRDQMQQTLMSVAGVISGPNAMSSGSFAAY